MIRAVLCRGCCRHARTGDAWRIHPGITRRTKIYSTLITAGSAAVEVAPTVVEKLKKRYPRAWSEISKVWKTSGGTTDLTKDVRAAVARGDNTVVAAAMRTIVTNGINENEFSQVLNAREKAAYDEFLAKVRTVIGRDVDLNDSTVASQGLAPEVIMGKTAEVIAVQDVTGYSLDDLRKLVVFINTTTVAQLDKIEQNALASKRVKVH